MILRGIGHITGDGWKDTTRKSEVVYVYSRTLPHPYEAGQHERVGCISWTASERQYDFVPAGFWRTLMLVPRIAMDVLERWRLYGFRWS